MNLFDMLRAAQRPLRPWMLLLFSWATFAGAAEDPFAAGVRPTPHLSPAAEQAALHVPPGFKVQLVAAEPDIAKPLNMAFDQRGRLWITDTLEYPYAVPVTAAGRDQVKILEDTNGDGRADKITTFADGLNIPIGVYPWGKGAIVFSIPSIWYLVDDDGDDRCDRRIELYGPFDHTRDTHGLNNAFRHGFDGWIYACHGFNNQSQVSGRDGNTVTLHSGNTYRFRLDGSRIEHFTHGQVNPFGMVFDAWGNLFTADCHSKPVYALLRGGSYPSFGKPDDGLGFVDPIMEHLHGSTAISGLVHCDSPHFPAPYAGNLLSGNVMTSRINRNSLVAHGSTWQAHEEPDFLVSDDPWFRPVDLQIAPDGSLYIADFYNRIIGHYEVPLPHPGRDRQSGRIWRVLADPADPQAALRPLAELTLPELLTELNAVTLTRRLQATQWIVAHHEAQGVEAVREFVQAAQASPWQRAHGLWILQRWQKLDEGLLQQFSQDSDAGVRNHLQKILAEMPQWSPRIRQLALRGLEDTNPFVQRAAADALAQHPDRSQTVALLNTLVATDQRDSHLRHTLRMAVRDHLPTADECTWLADQRLSAGQRAAMLDIILAVKHRGGAAYLTRALTAGELTERAAQTPELWDRWSTHVAEFGTADDLAPWIQEAAERSPRDVVTQLKLLSQISAAYQRSAKPVPPSATEWALRLATDFLNKVAAHTQPELAWAPAANLARTASETPASLSGNQPLSESLPTRPRLSADQNSLELFWDSLLLGEQATGRWRSTPFPCPAELSFYLAGHRGAPDQPPHTSNRIELRDAASDEVLATAYPPRNDVAQRVTWQLATSAARPVVIEIIDEDAADAWAWLAVGRFSYSPLNPATAVQDVELARHLMAAFELRELIPQVQTLLDQHLDHPQLSTSLAEMSLTLQPDWRKQSLVAGLKILSPPAALRQELLLAIRSSSPDATQPLDQLLIELFRACTDPQREKLAASLVTSATGQERLIELIEQGIVPAQLLQRSQLQATLAAAPAHLQPRIAQLLSQIPTEPAELGALLTARWEEFRRQPPPSPDSLASGKALFVKNCGLCHQRGGEGALVGPQLDGIGRRGAERVLEDILAPNRNVDVAFRTTTLITHDGQVHNGLVQETPGAATLKLIDQRGMAQQIELPTIAERHPSTVSLMPEQFGTQLSPTELYQLLSYLMQ